ncbi:sec-independent protein translocase protein TatA [Sediminihabitans luteus]|uniref:Sec-independent protein translocase protein TatA n=1 Tax=Sediminihabitans luteus TaxID=1138585 RepID=A0A2M9CQQ8_9CELL|nr:sec-independent protein translocase protein TatA [Sediminihabitans luteus]GII99115.1 hypothetical protein Slu03_14930 [Sediminihabitans luteus]
MKILSHPATILILILIIVLLFGSKRLPDLARSVGQSLKIFKKEVTDLRGDDKPATPTTPAAGPAPSDTTTGATTTGATGTPGGTTAHGTPGAGVPAAPLVPGTAAGLPDASPAASAPAESTTSARPGTDDGDAKA